MYSNIVLQRQWSKLACLCRYSSTVESQKAPQNSASSDGISPPLRIPRGPTDILQALAATVGPDPTAAHYKYHDDPYLIPLSNYRKRAYALSAEAGRKAAAWIRDEHSDLFATRQWDPPGKMTTPYFNADPRIEAFSPKPIYTDESKVTEEDLRYTIQNALLEDSVKVFQLLGGTEGVSEELKLQFLQLLCFCNEKELDSTDWLEERWFSANARERQAATWRLGGLADKIFDSLDPKSPEAYCALIQGMAKYYQAERAYVLYQEAREKRVPLSTGVFNCLIGCVGFLREGSALRMDALKDLLRQMAETGISPNHETLTSCLRSLSVWGAGKPLQQLALQIIAEFKQLNIQPGLSAYYYLMCLFCKERGPRVDILSLILNDLENRENLCATEATDTNFFITAMGVCNDHLQDINMAERVHALLMKGDNYKLVGDAYKESIYYRHLVTVACRHAPFERTTQLLDTLVPNVYVPEPSVMEEIIKTLEVGGAGDRLAQAWSQLVVFGLAKRARLVERLVEAMCSCYQLQDDEVKGQMQAAAVDILKFGKLAEEQQKTQDLRSPVQKLSANALCSIIELCAGADADAGAGAGADAGAGAGAGAWASVQETLARLRRGEAAGVPARPRELAGLAARAAAAGQPAVAATALTYLAECGFEEAITASVDTLCVMLNRPEAEVLELLSRPRDSLLALHPSAVAVAEAYHLAKSGAHGGSQDGSSASSSSSDSSDSDDE